MIRECRSTRSTSDNILFLSNIYKAIYTSSLEHRGPSAWNPLASSTRKLDYVYLFTNNLSKHLRTQMAPWTTNLSMLICEWYIVEPCLSGSNSGRRLSLMLFGADRCGSTWSPLSWSDKGYYHMVRVAVAFEIILYYIRDVSVAFVIGRGGALQRISEMLSELIFSLGSGLIFFVV